jgi:hypothetical protein
MRAVRLAVDLQDDSANNDSIQECRTHAHLRQFCSGIEIPAQVDVTQAGLPISRGRAPEWLGCRK